MKVLTEKEGEIYIITMNRPEVRNAIDQGLREQLADAFRAFQADDTAKVAILTGADGQFSSGGDLKLWSEGVPPKLSEEGDSPIGPVRMRMTKPVIAAVEGYAVAGGMALACWCDMRVVAQGAAFGMLDRRFGMPIIGGVTVSLPKLIGLSHAMDLILTGRLVDADESYRMGLANRLVDQGRALAAAKELALSLAGFPWQALVSDRKAVLEGMDMTDEAAKLNEFRLGVRTIESGESVAGAKRFASGEGRHGQ